MDVISRVIELNIDHYNTYFFNKWQNFTNYIIFHHINIRWIIFKWSSFKITNYYL